jgi:hypothetical protein
VFIADEEPFLLAKFRLHLIPTISDPFLLIGSDCLLLRNESNVDWFKTSEGK